MSPRVHAAEMQWHVLGQPFHLAMPAADAARLRVTKKRWLKVKANHRRAARAAIRRGAADAVEKVIQCLHEYESHERLPRTLDLVQDAPAEVFWPVFEECWTVCDDTWDEQERLLFLLKRHAQACISGEFGDSLPDVMQVYRGCSRDRNPRAFMDNAN